MRALQNFEASVSEASAITLAWQFRDSSLLILDEKRGRKVASALGFIFEEGFLNEPQHLDHAERLHGRVLHGSSALRFIGGQECGGTPRWR